MNKLKKGITMTSLVVYILLFTTFTVFVSNVSGNLNDELLDDRGQAINYSNLNKLQYNIDNSSFESYSVRVTSAVVVTEEGEVTDYTISYSNGDTYEYDAVKQVIYKNKGILCKNVSEFEAKVEDSINEQKVTIDVDFNKYLNEVTGKQIISCVEVR